MSWNYRVVKRRVIILGVEEEYYAIHSAHYKMKSGCKGGTKCKCRISLLSVDPDVPSAESLQDLRKVLAGMLAALDKPVIDYKTRKPVKEKKRGKRGVHPSK